jgi:DNA polymerase III delta prime subunit
MDGNALDVKLARLETAFEAHKEATQKALDLQAKEYNRRLRELNGEQSRIDTVLQRSVTRELFDMKISEIEKALRPIPMIVAGASLVAAAVAALLVRLLVP